MSKADSTGTTSYAWDFENRENTTVQTACALGSLIRDSDADIPQNFGDSTLTNGFGNIWQQLTVGAAGNAFVR